MDENLARIHMSRWFENVAREMISRIHGVRAAPWWGRDVEIDIVAPTRRGAYVYEVKYSRLDSKEVKRTLNRLAAKARVLPMQVARLGVIAVEAEGVSGDAEVLSLDELVAKALGKARVSVEMLG